MINIGIIDPDYASRKCIRTLLTKQNQYEIVIAFEVDRITLPLRIDISYPPHLILVDFKGHPPRIIRKIKEQFPHANMLVLSDNLQMDVVQEAIRNGALSYLCKATCLPNLLLAVLTAKDGGSVLSPPISKHVLGRIFRANLDEELLTARELQIARGIAAGLSYQGVASECQIALDTVRAYVKRIYRKLNINSKGELIVRFRWSVQAGG
ncbi:hypothetical protein GCM10007415_45150 [Parapedobacter pyrenivorans]|uniref:DNA-binding response regulator, NarL/FixJ family, contains REC and HTH domains n=1 Tax=Parapedobacter pyrenivorans TaxID=1305674 RepID=A0A917I1M1_9SPHI|nr:response regulator transcription factor [Parapedobacter pyrenivorans]GGH03948.1 hypothetical protein GCM10007415_45150 [Parapedobacter pyrenivorans]